MNKNRTIIKCECSLKSLIGFEVSKELAKTMVNMPVIKDGGSEAIGVVSAIDYDNDKVEMNIFSYALPQITIDDNGKATSFQSMEILSSSYEIEPSFKDRFELE